jgi:hypothetical protein
MSTARMLYACQDAERYPRVARYAGKFAALNGWRHSKTSFNLGQLAGLDRFGGDDGYRSGVSDHCFYFREPARSYRPVALVSQPYELRGPDRLADECGLVVRVPPILKSGWLYPGRTYMLVFVRPGAEVRWLREQVVAGAFERLVAEHEAGMASGNGG